MLWVVARSGSYVELEPYASVGPYSTRAATSVVNVIVAVVVNAAASSLTGKPAAASWLKAIRSAIRDKLVYQK